ncbi:MAG: LysE family translocator, partial [Bacteroidaceae bacterium]|nr:LysE family translocator [Bacteroidaceae bacterium]
FLFMAMMARLDFVVPERYWLQALAYLSIFGGALLLWLGLTAVIDKARERFQVSTILYFNRILGLIVIIASLVAIFTTIL